MTEVLDATDSPVRVALDDLGGALDRLHGIDLWGLGSGELIRVTGELQRLLRRTEALTVKVVGEVDLRGAALARGATSTAAWLRWQSSSRWREPGRTRATRRPASRGASA